MVEKEVIDNRTRTNIIQLNQEERIQEITRMLGGDQTTLEVIDHAKAMINAKHSKN
jgi:DNA repair protein RecN (Recombination protein N)